ADAIHWGAAPIAKAARAAIIGWLLVPFRIFPATITAVYPLRHSENSCSYGFHVFKRRALTRRIPVQQRQSTFHPRAQRNAFRRRDAHPQRRSFAPQESSAEMQPQLPPALLRLSEAWLIVVDHLRRSFARFNFGRSLSVRPQ